MRSRVFLLNIIILLLYAGSLRSQPLRLEDCQVKARANYPLVKQYDLIAKSTEYTISNASKAYLPQISVTGIGGYIIQGLPTMIPGAEASKDKFQFIGIAQVNQALWDGGATRAQKEIEKASAEVDKASIDVALYAITERVNQLFFSILLLDEQHQLLNLLKDNLERNSKAVKLSNENGLAYSMDVDEVKVEILKVEQRITELVYTRQGYAKMLALMTGVPADGNIQLVKPGMDALPEPAPINRPELSLYQFQRKQLEAGNKMIKAGNMPKIGLLGAGIMIQPGMAFGTEKLKSLAIAGLNFSWNTRNLYTSSNNRELSRISLDRINNQQETFLFNTNLQLTQQQSDIEKQKTVLAKDIEILKLKSNIKKAYELKYQNGMCTMNDLLMATNGESDASANRALHEIQLLMSIYAYKTTSGN
ncbi:TolC family protein [Flavihumibacter profundi]|uniref:TolC family protein n=1 Tax=Flavihumibacter profundi TaxID=2716883 RepID=UPI001CC79895|nr:TolC family protein [Flavihumibacter profundi]MBZ5856836.1 TolC family protein [Flavihumibacter profundi]